MDKVLTSAPAITKVSDTIARGGEAKRAGTCKGVLFTGSGVPRNLPGFQLIADIGIAWLDLAWRGIAWRSVLLVGVMRVRYPHTRRADKRGRRRRLPGRVKFSGVCEQAARISRIHQLVRPSVCPSGRVRPSRRRPCGYTFGRAPPRSAMPCVQLRELLLSLLARSLFFSLVTSPHAPYALQWAHFAQRVVHRARSPCVLNFGV